MPHLQRQFILLLKFKMSNYLQDDKGNNSSMRLMCLISLFAAIGFGYLAIMQSSEQGVYICLSFLLSAFAPKAIQKQIENNKP